MHRRAACFPGKNESSGALEELSQSSASPSSGLLPSHPRASQPQAPQQRLRTHSSTADQSWHTEVQLHKVQGRQEYSPSCIQLPTTPTLQGPTLLWEKKKTTLKAKSLKIEWLEWAHSMLAYMWPFWCFALKNQWVQVKASSSRAPREPRGGRPWSPPVLPYPWQQSLATMNSLIKLLSQSPPFLFHSPTGLCHSPDAGTGNAVKCPSPPGNFPPLHKEFHWFIPSSSAQHKCFPRKKPRKIHWQLLWLLRNRDRATESPAGF